MIAKWYLGGPLTNSCRAKWSMDDMSLPGFYNTHTHTHTTHWGHTHTHAHNHLHTHMNTHTHTSISTCT